jgi:hypothetical protein
MGAMTVCLMPIQNNRLYRILVVIGCSALADMVALATEHLFVADVHPLDLALASQRIVQPVQAAADDAVDPLDPGRREGFSELIGDGLDLSLLKVNAFVLSAALEMGVATSTGTLGLLRVS